MEEDRLSGVLTETLRNATLGWVITLGLCLLAIYQAVNGSYRWFVFTGFAVAIVLAPAIRFGDPRVMPPWELLLVVAIPVVDAVVLGGSVLNTVAVYVAVATVALVAAVEIHRFTPVRMNHSFAVGLVVLATLAVAATWNVGLWVADVTVGTSYIVDGRSADAANHAMMLDFVYATIAGLLAGLVFDRYVRLRDGTTTDRTGVPLVTGQEDEPDPPTPPLVERLDIPDDIVRRLSRGMQVLLGVVLLYGLVTRDLTTIANASIAIGITFLPAVLERDARLPLEPGLVFWLTGAVFLHALGSAVLYDLVGPWDNLTHALSASIVAAAGYAVVRAIDLHTDEVSLPPTMLFVFILVFVLAFGVLWELVEFGIDQGAQRFGFEAVLAQHGIHDTISDLLFDVIGAVVAAIWGTFYLTELSHGIASRLGG